MVENRQKHRQLQEVDRINHLQYEKEKESRQRVWEHLEKVLDEAEQEVVTTKEEFTITGQNMEAENYFNWDLNR